MNSAGGTNIGSHHRWIASDIENRTRKRVAGNILCGVGRKISKHLISSIPGGLHSETAAGGMTAWGMPWLRKSITRPSPWHRRITIVIVSPSSPSHHRLLFPCSRRRQAHNTIYLCHLQIPRAAHDSFLNPTVYTNNSPARCSYPCVQSPSCRSSQFPHYLRTHATADHSVPPLS